jgi:hypothetical protein
MPQSLVEIGQKMWKLVRTDRQTDSYIPPQTMFAGGYKNTFLFELFPLRQAKWYPV